MAFGNGYTFGFALGICLVCSLSLSAVSLGLKDQQEANVRRDLQKNIMLSLGLPEKGEVSGSAIDSLLSLIHISEPTRPY